jgi:hypothetical protein
LLRNRLRLID